MSNKLQTKYESMGLIHPDELYQKRLKFIKWARSERYTLREIGELLNITKEAVYKILKVDSK